MSVKTTSQVAEILGTSRKAIVLLLWRYPHLRPSNKTGDAKLHLWNDEEIEALKAHKMAHKRGRPSSKKEER